MNKKENLAPKIRAHGEKLNKAFNTSHDPVALCKAVFRLENKMHKAALDYCNLADYGDQYDKVEASVRKSLAKWLGDSLPVYINSDPRGYALKIDDNIMRERNIDLPTDWGGYGVIAPDLRNQ